MSKLTIALVAHDHKKPELLAWVKQHISVLEQCNLVGTGSTGGLIATETGLNVTRFKSGPLGGDQQLGAMIAEGRLHMLVFFQDPMSPMPHDVDVKALVRLCAVYDIPLACNRSTGDMMITSPMFADVENLRRQVQPEERYRSYASRSLPRGG